MDEQDEIDVAEELRLDVFDIGTCIRIMTDGSLQLRLGLMPPSWRHRDGAFDVFQAELAEVLGVSVLGLDKELFAIREPKPDTVERLRTHLLALRRRLEQR